MRRLAGFLAGTMAVVLIAGTASAQQAAGPRFEVDQKHVDLGGLVRGEVTEAIFVIRNSGDTALEIVGVRPG
jgi:hypothetical protein